MSDFIEHSAKESKRKRMLGETREENDNDDDRETPYVGLGANIDEDDYTASDLEFIDDSEMEDKPPNAPKKKKKSGKRFRKSAKDHVTPLASTSAAVGTASKSARPKPQKLTFFNNVPLSMMPKDGTSLASMEAALNEEEKEGNAMQCPLCLGQVRMQETAKKDGSGFFNACYCESRCSYGFMRTPGEQQDFLVLGGLYLRKEYVQKPNNIPRCGCGFSCKLVLEKVRLPTSEGEPAYENYFQKLLHTKGVFMFRCQPPYDVEVRPKPCQYFKIADRRVGLEEESQCEDYYLETVVKLRKKQAEQNEMHRQQYQRKMLDAQARLRLLNDIKS